MTLTPNTSLHRTPAALPPSPVSSKPLGVAIKQPAGVRYSPPFGFAGVGCVSGWNARITSPARCRSRRTSGVIPAHTNTAICQN